MSNIIDDILERCTEYYGVHGDVYVDQKKFAELIIQECINQIGEYTADIQVGKEYSLSMQKHVPVFRIVDAETTLRKHFGANNETV